MRNKLLVALAIISLWFVCLAPACPGVEAAKGGGGVRLSAPKAALPAAPKTAAPKASAPAAPAANANTKVNRNQPVKDLPNEQRINTSTGTAAANAAPRSSSRWGGALRNIGLFTGGMLLGSLLSHYLGWGNMGWGADFLGLLINLILVLIIIRLILSIWRFLRRR